MSNLGYGIGLCSTAATSIILPSIADRYLTGIKFLDKFVVPVGIIFIAVTVGDAVENKVNKDICYIKNNVYLMMGLQKRTKDKEVTDNGNS